MSETIPEEGIIARIKYSKGYLFLMILIMGLGHVLDEYSTLAPGMIKSSMIDEFFVQTGWKTQDEALQLMNMLMLVTIIIMMGATLFKSLIDRVGRKPIFILSAIGMTLGMIIMILSKGYWVYFTGGAIGSFFLFNDIQYIYIQEETPARKRAQFFSYAKILGLSGLLLVPLIRNFTVVEGSENWRPVLYPPLIIGAIVILLSIFFLKETRAYQIMKEDRESGKLTGEEAKEKVSIREAFRALRNAPTWKQIKWLIILPLLFVSFAPLNQGYSEVFMDQADVLLSDRNIVLTISTIFVGVAYFLNGIIADRVGRKASMYFNAGAVIALLVFEYFSMWAAPTSNAKMLLLVLAAISQGFRIGAFWNITDVHRMMILENTPTRLRGNVLTIQGLIMMSSLVLSVIITGILIEAFPGNIQAVLLIVGIPAALAVVAITWFKLEETVDVDITAIKG